MLAFPYSVDNGRSTSARWNSIIIIQAAGSVQVMNNFNIVMLKIALLVEGDLRMIFVGSPDEWVPEWETRANFSLPNLLILLTVTMLTCQQSCG